MNVLVVNVGSSTIKLRVVRGGHEERPPDVIPSGSASRAKAELAAAIDASGPIDAVGHRIVHGGTEFSGPVLLDEDVVARLEQLVPLAPLHQGPALEAVAVTRSLLPDTPAVGCFDTSFFAGMPAAARTYALPREWRERFGLQRFGFHGLSHAYASRRVADIRGRLGEKVVTCHLGAGASLAAVRDGVPVDTTMGFTPLEGLVMATRSGNVDPGLPLWLQTYGGMSAEEVADGLTHRSGLEGLAGSADMRAVISAAASGDPDARLALDVYLHRLRASIAAMAAAMDGVDAVAFTGGVGENAPEVRAAALDGLSFLGVAIDEELNRAGVLDGSIAAAGARVDVLVIAAREDLEIARQTEALLVSDRSRPNGSVRG